MSQLWVGEAMPGETRSDKSQQWRWWISSGSTSIRWEGQESTCRPWTAAMSRPQHPLQGNARSACLARRAVAIFSSLFFSHPHLLELCEMLNGFGLAGHHSNASRRAQPSRKWYVAPFSRPRLHLTELQRLLHVDRRIQWLWGIFWTIGKQALGVVFTFH